MTLKVPTSEDIIKWSLFYLHVLLGVFGIAVLVGRESSIIGDMFSATLTAILFNLGIVSGNKALQKFADKSMPSVQKSTVVTSTTTETAPLEPATPESPK